MDTVPTLTDIYEAAKRIEPYIPKTPVFRSDALDRETGAELLFKMECLMPQVGSFKARGAMNALLQLTPEERERGVLTQSSGNHAQAIAWAAGKLGIKSSIVMPSNANPVKKRNVREFGGEILECEPGDCARNQLMEETRKATNAVIVHPFNDYRVIAGQGTAAFELYQEIGPVHPLDAIVVPVGGGGLLSGTAIASGRSRGTRIIAGEPAGAADTYRSVQAGSIQPNETVNTIADGLITTVGEKTFPIILKHVDRIVVVTDTEIAEAMRQLWERLRSVVEPSGAVSFAAVLKDLHRFRGKKVGVILSGGNANLDQIPFTAAGR